MSESKQNWIEGCTSAGEPITRRFIPWWRMCLIIEVLGLREDGPGYFRISRSEDKDEPGAGAACSKCGWAFGSASCCASKPSRAEPAPDEVRKMLKGASAPYFHNYDCGVCRKECMACAWYRQRDAALASSARKEKA